MDVQDKLLIRFLNEDDGTGKLHVRAHCNGFSGDGSAWFSTEQLKEFASALAAFPIPEENPPAIRSGFYRKDNSGEIEEEHLSLRYILLIVLATLVFKLESRLKSGLKRGPNLSTWFSLRFLRATSRWRSLVSS